MNERERLKIDTQPIKLRIESEPYVRFLGKKYSAVIDVFDIRKKREHYIIIDAQSLSQPLYALATQEGGLKDIEVWIAKGSDEKYARYEVSIA